MRGAVFPGGIITADIEVILCDGFLWKKMDLQHYG